MISPISVALEAHFQLTMLYFVLPPSGNVAILLFKCYQHHWVNGTDPMENLLTLISLVRVQHFVEIELKVLYVSGVGMTHQKEDVSVVRYPLLLMTTGPSMSTYVS